MAEKQITPKRPKADAPKDVDRTAERKSLKKLSHKKLSHKKLSHKKLAK